MGLEPATLLSDSLSTAVIQCRGQTEIYGLFCEFVAPPRKKKLVTIFSQGHVWGPQKPMFY